MLSGLFAVLGVLEVAVTYRYFAAIGETQADRERADEMSTHPTRIPALVWTTSIRRYRLLFSRQPQPEVERLRLAAVVLFISVWAVFLWIVFGFSAA